MKILAIRGRNIASIVGDFEIDFQKEPLASAGLFAIVGPTGSGKSTLLDVLCLALYGRTPRTDKAKENNVAIAELGGKSLSPHDSRSLLRRGCVEGYAEADFVALSGEPYRATWSVRRSRNKADGALQEAEQRLFNLKRHAEEGGKKGELREKIQQLVGLSFEQFTRSVLLAQGDFATFLKAAQGEKAEILEKLTGTEIYSRISAEIYQRNKAALEQYNVYKIQTEGLHLMSEEERQTLLAEYNALLPDVKQQSEACTALQQQVLWLKRYDEQVALEKEAQEAWQQAQAQEAAFAAAHPTWPQIEKAWQIKPLYADYLRDEREGQQAGQEKNTIEQKIEALVAPLAALQQQHIETKTAFETWQQQYEAQDEPNLEKARSLRTQAKEQKAFFSARMQETADEQARCQKYEKDLGEAVAQKEKAEQDLAAERAYAESHEAEKRWAEQGEWLLKLCESAVAEALQQQRNEALLQTNLAQLQQEKADLAEKEKWAQQLSEALPEKVFELRRQLEDEKPCPVCGAVHHPWRDRIDVLSEDENRLQQDKAAAQDAIGTLTKHIRERETECDRLSALTEQYGARALADRQELGAQLQAVFPQWETALQNGTLKADIEQRVSAWKAHESRVQAAERLIAQAQTTREGLQRMVAQSKAALQEKQKECAELDKQIQDLVKAYQQLFGEEKLEAVENRFKEQRRQLESKMQTAEKAWREAEEQKKLLQASLLQWTARQAELNRSRQEKQQQIEAWLHEHPDIGGDAQLQALLSTKEADFAALSAQSRTLLQNMTKTQSILDERRSHLNAHLQVLSHPDPKADRAALAASEAAVRTALEQKQKRQTELELLFKQEDQQQEKLKHLTAEQEKARLVYEQWSKLNELFGSADGGKFKQMAQAYTLDWLLGYANRHLSQLTKRYTLQRIPDTLALQVIDGDMLGEVRSVHSLSGGESFLVSLALALGLASLSSASMRVDSLFIDEGFGSLDADTLQTAMAALEHLQTQGRKIGVISHVGEMTERMACRILVEPTGGGGSRVRVG